MVVPDLCAWVVLWLITLQVTPYIVDLGIVNKHRHKYLGGKTNHPEQ